jgi:hypothetical protein
MYGSHTDAQPKPPWAKNSGGLLGLGVDGIVERSSSRPKGVLTYDLVIPDGSDVPVGGLVEGARHWSAKGPKGMMVRRG